MKRLLVLAVTLAGLSGCAGMDGDTATSNNSGSDSSSRKYKSCASLSKKYPHGVGIKGAKDTTEGTRKPTKNYRVNASVYRANKRLDRDEDGIACEYGRG
jgi:hypothetical protein